MKVSNTCKICGFECKSLRGLSKHIRNKHKEYTVEDYYVEFYKSQNEGFCENCGKQLPFIKLSKPYMLNCSRKCAGENDETKQRREYTNIKKIGCKNPFQSEEIKSKIHSKLYELYGGIGVGSEVISNKIKNTNLMNIGVENPFENKKIIDSMIKNKQQRIKLFELDNDCTERQHLIDIFGAGWLKLEDELKCVWMDKGHKFILNSEIPKIKEYAKLTRFKSEHQLLEYIKTIYSDDIEIHNRTIIKPKEIDIYLHKLNLAIEYNGDYWHNTDYKYTNYHYDKTMLCGHKGIRLLHIFESDWIHNQQIWKNLLVRLIKNNHISINDYKIKEIYSDIAKKFVEDNYLRPEEFMQINRKHFGFFYDNKLIQVVQLTTIDNSYVIEFCVNTNKILDGWLNKLITQFKLIDKTVYMFIDNEFESIDDLCYNNIVLDLIEVYPPEKIRNKKEKIYDAGRNLYEIKLGG